jgi:hypothetical protein
MTRPILAAVLTGAVLLEACQPKAQPSAAAAAPAPQAPVTPAFTVEPLVESDYSGIQGCATVFRRAGTAPGNNLFVEDAVDTDAKGLMRIDGTMVGVKLVSQTHTSKGGLRLFRSADGKLSVAENYLTGTAHEDTDSVEMSGTLTVTWNGASQALKVDGGTAC